MKLFVLGTPSIPEEKQHKLRCMYGVGLSKDIWTEFVSRFQVQLAMLSNLYNIFKNHDIKLLDTQYH